MIFSQNEEQEMTGNFKKNLILECHTMIFFQFTLIELQSFNNFFILNSHKASPLYENSLDYCTLFCSVYDDIIILR